MKAMYFARTFAGMVSESTACATGASPPTPHADEKAEHHEGGDIPCAGGKKARNAPDDHGALKCDAAAEQVGRRADEQVAGQLAEKRHGGEVAHLHRGQIEVVFEIPDEKDKQGDVDLVGEPCRCNYCKQPLLIGGHRQPLEPARNVETFRF
jgi:hypothetical protein